MLHEARICEILKESPHPSVAAYLGCVKQNARLTGLCFAKCKKTLWERVEMGEDSSLGRPPLLENALAGIQKGIEHIHSLGFCHSDINPQSIMLGGDDAPVIIDFDACCAEGKELGVKKGARGHCAAEVKLSSRESDFCALQKVKEFVMSSLPKGEQ
eukprot:Plantae.Rhodophyta-Hildenbrandia_rubra.ctg26704.p1 GENE.Plantae.Rhodophyta-Hildenbrandia_rubra.ctg26704~~Plantae.Rhodophyta-Hildenbrandia_rubra.ctg26704.p1  ORF type:complete len:157 (+),score=15.77 Plantae.Rhodophyta-Hildenbrandia_rubra.ctg26704:467-937(+)